MADKDYYDLLGVKKSASDAELKKAYRTLAKKFHPDRNKGNKDAENRFKEISEAYAVLSDKDKRAQYDRLGREAFSPGAGGANPFAGFDFSQFADQFGGARGRRAGGRHTATSGNFTDIFSDLFGGGGFTGGFEQGPQAAPLMEAEMTIDFRDAVLGATMELTVNGEHVKVRIPEGVGDASKIRVRRKGEPDLQITVHVRPHPFFERRGDDIHIELPITIPEALRGAEVEVPTIHGPVRARIPAATQGGQTFRLKGKGVKKKGKEAGNGDHYYKVQIVVPREVPAETAEKLEEAYHGLDPRAGLPTSI